MEVADLGCSNQNVDAEYVWEDGHSALTKAAYFGHIEVVRLLVETYKVASIHRGTPLHAAAHRGHVEMVRYLLKLGLALLRRSTKRAVPHYTVLLTMATWTV